MPFTKVARLSELPPGSVTEVIAGENTFAICNAGGTVTAISGTCLHRGGPLGQGIVRGNYVVCPWHAWQWDCRTGENDLDPSRRLACFDVRIEGDDILIELP